MCIQQGKKIEPEYKETLAFALLNIASVDIASMSINDLIVNNPLDGRTDEAQYKSVAALYTVGGFNFEEIAFILGKSATATISHWQEIKRKLWRPLWQVCCPGPPPPICKETWCIQREGREHDLFEFAEKVLKGSGERKRQGMPTSGQHPNGQHLTDEDIRKFVSVATGRYRVSVRNHVLTCVPCSDKLQQAMRKDVKKREIWFSKIHQENREALNKHAKAKLSQDHDLAQDLVAGTFNRVHWGLPLDSENITIKGWLITVLNHLISDEFPTTKSSDTPDEAMEPQGETITGSKIPSVSLEEMMGGGYEPPTPEKGYGKVEDDEVIKDFLKKNLNEEDYMLFTHSHAGNMTLKEISHMMTEPDKKGPALSTLSERLTRIEAKLLKAAELPEAAEFLEAFGLPPTTVLDVADAPEATRKNNLSSKP